MSPWMQAAGTFEAAVRTRPLAGVLACAQSFTMGQRLSDAVPPGGACSSPASRPLSVWAGRNGRIYALVMLLSLASSRAGLAGAATPHGALAGLRGTLAIGAMTHYYLEFLWAVQAALIVTLPRRTRTIRVPWHATLGAIGLVLACSSRRRRAHGRWAPRSCGAFPSAIPMAGPAYARVSSTSADSHLS